MRRFLRENSLSLVFFALFAGALIGDAFAGWKAFNADAVAHSEATIGFWRYVTTSDFGRNVLENWQSEYLQFTLFVLGTVWLLQRGSPESKELGKAGLESDEEQQVGEHAGPHSPKWARVGGLRTFVYSNSLLLVMGAIFLGSWLGQSITGRVAYNAERFDHQQGPLSWWEYVGTPDFWNRTLQNWQSEFLAVGSMAVLAIYLRQRGSPESKPVGASHASTGVEG